MKEHAKIKKHTIRARVHEFKIPPIYQGLVLGKNCPIGRNAMSRALNLLMSSPFVHIDVGDDIVGDIFVKESVLRRIPQEKLIDFVLQQIKPFMGPDEILHLDLETEVLFEENL